MHSGIYGITKSDLIKYLIETVNEKSSATNKRLVKVGDKRKKVRKDIN